jgi:hypothetical protein
MFEINIPYSSNSIYKKRDTDNFTYIKYEFKDINSRVLVNLTSIKSYNQYILDIQRSYIKQNGNNNTKQKK